MATVTTTFYRNTYNGTFDGEDADLLLLLGRAEEVIDGQIYLSGKTVADITGDHQTAVYKAVCAQADCIESAGGLDCMSDAPLSSATLGKFSFSAGGTSCDPSTMCQLATNYLQSTGLLYRGL